MKLIGDVDCPHCKQKHDAEIDIDNLKINTPEIPKVTNVTSNQQVQQVQEQPVPQIKEVIKEKKVVSSDQPFFECKDCDSLHKNPNYKDAPKKRCANGDCGTLNKSKAKGCKNCGSSEFEEDELTDEELQEIGIPIPESHEGHNHESE